MLWKTIDDLTNRELSLKGGELRQRLENFNDQDLVLFHRDAVSVFLLLFNPGVYHLYCTVFAGEANGSGLTDFCLNLILSGRSLVDAVLLNPDNFSDVKDAEPFNQDNGLSVSSIAWHVLVRRYDVDATESMFRSSGVQSCEGIWEELENQVGSLTFEPDWRLAEATMPRIYARMKR